MSSVPQVLEEPTLFYQPSYDTMLEDELAWHFTKYLAEDAAFQDHTRVQTPYAEFDVDFLVELGKQRIGFMCGHMESDNERAESGFKDALLIDAGGIDVVYRFRQEDLQLRLHDCLQIVAAWNPGLFSFRGIVNLETLASPDARAFRPSYNDSLFSLSIHNASREDRFEDEPFVWPSEGGGTTEVFFRRMDRQHPAAWLYEYERALVHYGVSPEMLRQKWSKTA